MKKPTCIFSYATPAIQCARRVFHSYLKETKVINNQFLNAFDDGLTFRFITDQGPGLQCLLKFKVDLKLRTENLAYGNGHLEIIEIKTISCIL